MPNKNPLPKLRQNVLDNLSFLGIDLDNTKNTSAEKEERKISSDSSRVNIYVIPTNEELVIALDTMKIVQELS